MPTPPPETRYVDGSPVEAPASRSDEEFQAPDADVGEIALEPGTERAPAIPRPTAAQSVAAPPQRREAPSRAGEKLLAGMAFAIALPVSLLPFAWRRPFRHLVALAPATVITGVIETSASIAVGAAQFGRYRRRVEDRPWTSSDG